MDKNTLSHYGWIVVLILILSVLLALATPFGLFVARGFEATYVAFSLGDYDNLGNVIDEMGGNTAEVIPPPDVDDGNKHPDEGIDIKPDIKLIKIDKSENGRLLVPDTEVYFCEYELDETIFNEAKEKGDIRTLILTGGRLNFLGNGIEFIFSDWNITFYDNGNVEYFNGTETLYGYAYVIQ